MIIKTDALVLKTFDYRETSCIGTFFTNDYGKVKGIMKGIRKNPKKFGSTVDRFSLNEIVYYQYNSSDLHLISQCDLKQYFFQIRQDYKRNLAANYMLELLDIVMPVEEPNHKVYALALDYLNALEHMKDIDKLVHIFQIKMLLHSGFSPHLDSCVRCGQKVLGRVQFSMKSGGLICSHCPSHEATLTGITKGTVSSILHIEKSAWNNALRLGLGPVARREIKFILNNFLVYHLGRRVKSAKYL